MEHKNIAIVLAAGQGKRMQSKVHKQYLLMQGKPVIYYTLRAFEESFIDEIILVVGPGEEEYCQNEIVDKFGFHKVKKIVVGGKERYHSVYQGLCAVSCVKDAYIFIHDGARPFVTSDILQRAYEEVKTYAACVVGVPVKDTVKIVNENGFVAQTPDRSLVWQIQTPQVFQYEMIKNSYQQLIDHEQELLASGVNITDDAMVVEYFTKTPVKLVMGSYQNIKITTPEDLQFGEMIIS